MTGGRINHFNITKQAKARNPPRLTAFPASAISMPSRRRLVLEEEAILPQALGAAAARGMLQAVPVSTRQRWDRV